MAKFQQNQKISNQERLLILNVECWNWTYVFSLLQESPMCNFTLPDIFYMQWHSWRHNFIMTLELFKYHLKIPEELEVQYVAAEQGAQAGPSVSIVPVGPSDVVGQQPQQAEKVKPMPTGTVDTFFCYFKCFSKYLCPIQPPKNLIQLWYASKLLPRKWRNSFFNADYSPNTRNTQSGGDSPPPPYNYDETGNLAQGTTPPPLEKKFPDGIWW